MIRWLLESDKEIDEPPESFLSEKERATFDLFHFEKRRKDWLLGRWTAKRLVQAILLQERNELVMREAVEIFTDADGAPSVCLNSEPVPFQLSISHSHGSALCAIHTNDIGADLEWIEPREHYLLNDYFTADEQARVNTAPFEQRDTLVNGIWSAKEAGLKALHTGLRIDTRAVEIFMAPVNGFSERWMPFQVQLHLGNAAAVRGWWRVLGGFVCTLASRTNDVPDKSPTLPETFLIASGVKNGQGHGVLSHGIAHSTRHHARHHKRD